PSPTRRSSDLAPAQARADTPSRDAHLADAERAYREALLLQPHDLPAKWNLELVARMSRGGASRPPPQAPPRGGGAPPEQPPGGGGGGNQGSGSGGRTETQADQVLKGISQEQPRT